MPKITVSDVRTLLDSRTSEPVLYVDVEAGLRLDVWASANVQHYHHVLTRQELVDWLGEDISDDEIADILPELQETVDQVVANHRSLADH